MVCGGEVAFDNLLNIFHKILLYFNCCVTLKKLFIKS